MRNIFDYPLVISHQSTITSMSSDHRDINVFLPVRGRHEFLHPCVAYIKRASEYAGIKVGIIVVENDDTPTHQEKCKKLGVEYIFISTQVSCSDGMFAKSLCYNVGFLCAERTEWNVFHDLDILVPHKFFKLLKTYLDQDPSWVQPYTHNRVMRLSDMETKGLVHEPLRVFDLDCLGTPSKPGSPGGSIVVRSNDFLDVGGYDPEYFYGYSPEDSFFWSKLEVLYDRKDEVFSTHFQGSAMYADDPAIELYHLDHPPMVNSNRIYQIMLNHLHSFYRSSYNRKTEFVNRRGNQFRDALETIKNMGY